MEKGLYKVYKKQVLPALLEEFQYKNIEEAPKVLKVSINLTMFA